MMMVEKEADNKGIDWDSELRQNTTRQKGFFLWNKKQFFVDY